MARKLAHVSIVTCQW